MAQLKLDNLRRGSIYKGVGMVWGKHKMVPCSKARKLLPLLDQKGGEEEAFTRPRKDKLCGGYFLPGAVTQLRGTAGQTGVVLQRGEGEKYSNHTLLSLWFPANHNSTRSQRVSKAPYRLPSWGISGTRVKSGIWRGNQKIYVTLINEFKEEVARPLMERVFLGKGGEWGGKATSNSVSQAL